MSTRTTHETLPSEAGGATRPLFHTRVLDHAGARGCPSGGQKQRILLARALYKNPGILVLDEATSHLDVHDEQAVNAAMRFNYLTRVIVAHRPETIATAQRVIRLADREIVEDFMQDESAALV